MNRKVKVAVIGAGTSGISAFKEVSKVTADVVLIDPGPYGTTCARIGCMPSKVFIQIAEDYHRREFFEHQGINGADQLSVDVVRVMEHVRFLRDYFTSGVIRYLDSLKDQLIRGTAKIIGPNLIEVDRDTIEAEKIIIASGSQTIIPPAWQPHYEKFILSSENIFEQIDFPSKVVTIGAGVIGLELGQALHRLGVETKIIHAGSFIGTLSDPEVNQRAIEIMNEQFPLHLCQRADVEFGEAGVIARSESQEYAADKVLAAMGRRPNLSELGLESAGIELGENGIPPFDENTMQIGDTNFFIAGDVDKSRPLLHEAADDGRIAGFNAVSENIECFQRRIPITVLFCQPNIALVGKRYNELDLQSTIIGEVNFEDQGRSRILNQNKGKLRIYADKSTGCLLGAEMIAPAAEHLAHLIAWAIQQKLTATDILQMPYYHPTVEEGMRTAIRQIVSQLPDKKTSIELALCDSEAPPTLS